MSQSKVTAPLDLLGVIEGFYAAEILLELIRCGALERLATARTPEALARDTELDPKLLDLTLDFLSRTTVLIERERRGRYRLGNIAPAEIVFQVEKFVGAYGGTVRGLGRMLRGLPNVYRTDEAALAAAFAVIGGVGLRLTERLRREGCRFLLDLGCGSAALPIQLALLDESFAAICIDDSEAMCRLAKSRVRAAGVSSRVRVRKADVREIRDVVTLQERRRVDVIHGRSLLNALFGRGSAMPRAFLRQLRTAFPGRTVFFVDYYSELGRTRRPARYRLAQVQDLAQLASGQGLPPWDRRGWRALYEEAGCELRSAQDFVTDDIRWFIHEVRLSR
jgi:SAM-dependent methyltransferase